MLAPWKKSYDQPAATAAKSLQSCPTLCDPIDSSSPGSPVPGIIQARTLEWLAISFSNAWKWKVKVKLLSCVRLLATPWTAAHQAPPSTGFSRQENWNGLPLPSLVRFNIQYENFGTGIQRTMIHGKEFMLWVQIYLSNWLQPLIVESWWIN